MFYCAAGYCAAGQEEEEDEEGEEVRYDGWEERLAFESSLGKREATKARCETIIISNRRTSTRANEANSGLEMVFLYSQELRTTTKTNKGLAILFLSYSC